MSRRSRRGYQEYRGRSRGGSVVLKVIIVLLALILIAGIVFVLFLGKYVEYTDDGVRFNLPWQQAQESEPPVHSDPVVIYTPEPTTEPPTPTPQVLTALRAVEVTPAQLTAGTAAQAVTDAGGDTLVITMKEATGRLLWQSKTELAETYGLNAADRMVEWAVKDLAENSELRLAARIDCFRDVALAKAGELDAALMTRGGNLWYDARGRCWVSPASKAVTDYLIALCLELADMGFDEIVLDSAGYPYAGEVGVLATDDRRPEDRTAPVAAFCEKLSEALAGRDVTLSIVINELPAPEKELYSGITAETACGYAQRIWLADGLDAEECAARMKPWADDAEKRLVIIGGADESGNWAKLR